MRYRRNTGQLMKQSMRVTRMREAGRAYGTIRSKTGWFPNYFLKSSSVGLENFDASKYGAAYLDLQQGDVIIPMARPTYLSH